MLSLLKLHDSGLAFSHSFLNDSGSFFMVSDIVMKPHRGGVRLSVFNDGGINKTPIMYNFGVFNEAGFTSPLKHVNLLSDRRDPIPPKWVYLSGLVNRIRQHFTKTKSPKWAKRFLRHVTTLQISSPQRFLDRALQMVWGLGRITPPHHTAAIGGGGNLNVLPSIHDQLNNHERPHNHVRHSSR